MAWTWAVASARGTSHARAGSRLQDAYVCFALEHTLSPFVAIVSDGAGSAGYGGQGASLVCRSIATRVRRYFEGTVAGLPGDAEVEGWIDETRDLIVAVAARRSLEPREFAATLLLVINCGNESLIAHIGDGCAVLKEAETGAWIAPSWPEQGEYASTTYFVTDEVSLRLRVTRVSAGIDAVVAFTDGLERLALDMVVRKPFARFFEAMIQPVLQAPGVGRDRKLSTQLTTYLDSDAVTARTDDDKTLILAIRR